MSFLRKNKAFVKDQIEKRDILKKILAKIDALEFSTSTEVSLQLNIEEHATLGATLETRIEQLTKNYELMQ